MDPKPDQSEPPQAGDALAGEEAAVRWRCGAEVAELVLLHAGTPPGFELQLLARVLAEADKRDAQARLRWRWQHVDAPVEGRAGEFYVLAEALTPEQQGRLVAGLDQLGDGVVFIGPAVRWFARTPQARGLRVALHWEDAAALEQFADDVVPSPAIIEVSGRWTTCCGGLAVTDLALLMLHELAGSIVTLQVMDALCLDRAREPAARQRTAASGALGALAPKLAEAVALMEANVEDPLQTDEIARMVGASRRQLERLFKKHLGTVPSRYYVDIRLQRARKLLRETRHSLLQVALMCGFSSGSHFSTTYGSVFGITPREERQRVLPSGGR